MSKVSKQDRAAALAELQTMIKPGDKIYCTLRSVSRSGMSRVISFHVIKGGELRKLDRDIVFLGLGDWPRGSGDGVKVDGCGMDMGFHIVYSLGRTLFPDGYCYSEVGIRPIDGKQVNVNIGRGHSGPMTKPEIADLVANGWVFRGGRNGDTSGWDNDGGYALQTAWL